MTVDPLIGRVLLGRYRVVRPLAKGGMGVVYLARAEGAAGFLKPVVIKRIIPNAEEKELIGMFVREARILSHLRHPNIAGIVDFAEEDGAHLMVLEYVHGFDLLQWRRYVRGMKQRFDVEIAIYIVLSVLDALSHAHRIERPDGTVVSIVHRDISLSNVLIDTEGHVKLIDFGIARMQGGDTGLYKTTTTMVKGKIPYVAPELLSGTAPTPGTDVYSCGVMLHDLLLGRNDLRGVDLSETVRRVVGYTPCAVRTVRDDVPEVLDEILARALSKNINVRFESADELAKALREVATLTPHEARARLLSRIRADYAQMPAALRIEPLEERERALRAPIATPAPIEIEVEKPEEEEKEEKQEKKKQRRLEAPQRSSRGWILGAILALLAVTAAVAALGVSYLGNQSRGAEQVFIVQEAAPRSVEAPEEEEPIAIAAPEPEPVVVEQPRAPRRPAQGAPRSGFAATFSRHRGAVEACLRSHAANIEGSPELAVRFVLGQDGAVREARVMPTALAATPLGACLSGVAEGVRFDAQDRDGVSFVIPITVERR